MLACSEIRPPERRGLPFKHLTACIDRSRLARGPNLTQPTAEAQAASAPLIGTEV